MDVRSLKKHQIKIKNYQILENMFYKPLKNKVIEENKNEKKFKKNIFF